MLELNKLYNMDCMQGMKEFPDGFFDLAIVDPPYGIGIDGQKKRVCGNPKHNRKEHIRKSWDKAIPPTQKPVKLYSWVLSLFARKGMKILDTHAGSGSSLIACYRQGGLDYVGFEIDEDYCRAAQARLEQEQAQMRLFDLLEQEQRKAQITIFNE